MHFFHIYTAFHFFKPEKYDPYEVGDCRKDLYFEMTFITKQTSKYCVSKYFLKALHEVVAPLSSWCGGHPQHPSQSKMNNEYSQHLFLFSVWHSDPGLDAKDNTASR